MKRIVASADRALTYFFEPSDEGKIAKDEAEGIGENRQSERNTMNNERERERGGRRTETQPSLLRAKNVGSWLRGWSSVDRRMTRAWAREWIRNRKREEEATVRIRANPRLWGAPRQKPPFRESQYTTELQFDINASALLVTPMSFAEDSERRKGARTGKIGRDSRPRIREQVDGCLCLSEKAVLSVAWIN